MPSNPEKKRGATFVLWGSIVVALILAAIAIRYFTHERIEVYTAKVSYQDLTKTSPTNGKVSPTKDFPAYAQAPGVVEAIYVDVGDKVKPGQLLLKLDDADTMARLASAESALQAAQLAETDVNQGGTQAERNTFAADLSRAQIQRQHDASSLEALQQLQQKGAASQAEVAASRDRLQVDDDNIRSIRQNSTQRYGQADRAGAQAKLADARAAYAAAQSAVASQNIRAPFAGTVYSIPVSTHDYVNGGTDLIYVADLNHVQITAYFDEPEVGNLFAGQPVSITWDAKPGKVWHGHVSVAPTSIVGYGQTRNVGECFITVDDAHDDDLQPNANVIVTVTVAQHRHVLTVPREALHADGAQPYVFRVIGNKLAQTPVQIAGGIINLTRAEITGGLAEDDVVATNAASTNRDLTNGLEVTPIQ